MWVIRGLLFLGLLFALVYFFVTNSAQFVDVNFFGRQFLGISIYWIVVVSYLLGFATSFVLAAMREYRFFRKVGALKTENKAQAQEIADLRTLPLCDEGGSPLDRTVGKEASGDELPALAPGFCRDRGVGRDRLVHVPTSGRPTDPRGQLPARPGTVAGR